MQYKNVQEHWGLIDTILVHPLFRSGENGWYNTMAALGAASELSFFNVRNRNVGIMWNNQDARDQFPYAFRLFSIGVAFFHNHQTSGEAIAGPFNDQQSMMFMNDLPRHCSLTLQIQQDERLKTHCLFASPGYGPYGDGYGRGRPRAMEGVDNGINHHLSTTTQGIPEMKRRWAFPDDIEIPRRASVSCRLRFSEYGREMLQAMDNNITEWFAPSLDDPSVNEYIPGTIGIQVSLVGERLIQQRGSYHA